MSKNTLFILSIIGKINFNVWHEKPLSFLLTKSVFQEKKRTHLSVINSFFPALRIQKIVLLLNYIEIYKHKIRS